MAVERWQRVSRGWPVLRLFRGRQFHAAYCALHAAGAVAALVALALSVGGFLSHAVAVIDDAE